MDDVAHVRSHSGLFIEDIILFRMRIPVESDYFFIPGIEVFLKIPPVNSQHPQSPVCEDREL